jgi:NADH-ubiquinone oxidoreductase chain 4
LPKAHVEAPVAGSIILAAILLKLGGYGLTRIVIIFGYINKILVNPIISIAIVGGVVTSIICLRQSDIKSIIAYSSVGHIGLIIAGVLTNSKLGVQAGLAIIIAHGIRSSAIFCIANINYGITQTRRITLTKGMLTIIPMLSL